MSTRRTPVIQRRSRRLAGASAETYPSGAPNITPQVRTAVPGHRITAATTGNPGRRRTYNAISQGLHEASRPQDTSPLDPAPRYAPPPAGPFTFTHGDPAWPLSSRDHTGDAPAPQSQASTRQQDVRMDDILEKENIQVDDLTPQMAPRPGIGHHAAASAYQRSGNTSMNGSGDSRGTREPYQRTAQSQHPQSGPTSMVEARPVHALESATIVGRLPDRQYPHSTQNSFSSYTTTSGPQQAASAAGSVRDFRSATQTTRSNRLAETSATSPSTPSDLPGHSAAAVVDTNCLGHSGDVTANIHECVICCKTEPADQLMQPCRRCTSWYCNACVADMFERAIDNPGDMAPRCHGIFQLHIGMPLLSPERAQAYRLKFEQWLATEKLFCPVKTCSTFIPERLYFTDRQFVMRLKDLIRTSHTDLILAIYDDPKVAIFRHSTSRLVCDKPQNLKAMSDRSYRSVEHMRQDLLWIANSAVLPTEDDRSMHRERLMTAFHLAMDQMRIKMGKTSMVSSKLPTLLACPTCAIGICGQCRQIAHAGKPCDTTDKDYELALMVQYGYKQCPICKTAVKRMFGCSHMQCFCGAHWCWTCQRQIDICGGTCGDDDDEGSDDDEQEYPEDVETVPPEPAGAGAATATATTYVAAPTATIGDRNDLGGHRDTTQASEVRAATSRRNGPFPDLDAGGSARWAEHVEFGEEPVEPSGIDVWSCSHSWKKMVCNGVDRTVKEGVHVECNRCWKKMVPPRAPKPASSDPKVLVEMAATDPYAANNTRHPPRAEIQSQQQSIVPVYDRVKLTPKAPSQRTSTKLVRKEDVPWSCSDCNVLYCDECMRIVQAKRLGDARRRVDRH
ncbi:E3 ubiquitin-protein ligase dbl4 [Sphaceloma murrayae]|uniref:RBR-type E3 ubiquitin transferase n=1 Tax=Sphaceloma murrayae TaxID=2082308 RepID=A0A2K1QUG6_9PEZI|nr:E3 ubiquitin-protein ligase dbl4 [Sphaceloma murrayae]